MAIDYAYEWPKTESDFRQLISMKSTKLAEIWTWREEVSGTWRTVGLDFYFRYQAEPISYGRQGTHFSKVAFNSN